MSSELLRDKIRTSQLIHELDDEVSRLRKALVKIAAYDDAGGNHWLRSMGSYAHFDEPGSVEIARAALEAKP